MAGTPLTRETVENTPTGAVEFDPSLLIEEDGETPVEVPTDPIVGAMGDEGAQAIAAYFQAHPEDAPTDEAWQAQFGQRFAQGGERFFDKAPVPRRGIRRLPRRRFGNIQRQHRPGATGSSQGSMINHAQIALEPDKMDGGSGFHKRDSNANMTT